METLFLTCLAIGILFAVVSVIFGDWLSQAMEGALDFLSLDGPAFLSPMTLFGGITTFGGAGLLLARYTALGAWAVVLLALLIAIALGTAVFFLYVRPMENSENSIAFTLQSLSGALGEVIVPIPATGYGEVLVRAGAGVTNQIAASFDRQPIPEAARVVVVEVKDSVLYVSEVNLTI
ncbi:protease [Paenibacillus sp. LHD-117]|uniref:protease n=1 Tax=Paenibacillus sp. LHD-117 TaxID=3071412 RepID=UPI0027E17D82|nr:protease [Paenibacillus sp. LHD-117]MDQ6420862.1 protease [Paenibacillus sp. LHD-117]